MLRILLAIAAFLLFSKIIPIWYAILISFWGVLAISILCIAVDMGYLASTDPTITGRFLFSMCIGTITFIATIKIEDDSTAFGILAAGLVLTIGLCLPIF